MSWTENALKKMNPEILQMSDSEFLSYSSNRLKELPRAQRRAKEREVKEDMATMRSLTPKQKKLMVQAVNHACGRAVQEELDKYNFMMDRCISAYLIIKNPDMSMDDIFKETEKIGNLIADDVLKFKDHVKREGGNEEMAVKKINKMEPEIRKVSGELLDKGVSRNEVIEELLVKFPTLSKSMLTNALKRVIEDRKAAELEAIGADDETIAAAEYIFEENEEKEEVNNMPIKCDKEAIQEKKEVQVPNTPNKVENEPQSESELKIVHKQLVVEGKYNKYTVYNECVKVGNKSFNSNEDIEKYHKEQIELFNKEMDELKKVMNLM